jgi:hypothetical protein
MANLQKLKAEILANGRIGEAEVARLRSELYAKGAIDNEEIQFLIDLRDEADVVSPAFEQFFLQAVKDNVLADGSVDDEEASWLRALLAADGVIGERQRQFLRELRGGANKVSAEFQRLCDECLHGSTAGVSR